MLSIEADTRKRKRSIMAGSGLEEELGEPSRKRTGSIMKTGDDYAIDDDAQQDEDLDIEESNANSGNISGEEAGQGNEDELADDIEEDIHTTTAVSAEIDATVSPKKRGRKRRKGVENGAHSIDDFENAHDTDILLNGEGNMRQDEDDNVENEGDDEAEAALKNEEERKFLWNLIIWQEAHLLQLKRNA